MCWTVLQYNPPSNACLHQTICLLCFFISYCRRGVATELLFQISHGIGSITNSFFVMSNIVAVGFNYYLLYILINFLLLF